MAKRGRKSAVELTMPRVDGSPPPLEVRARAPDEVQAIFREIVEVVSTQHFRVEDGHLLEQYTQAIALSRISRRVPQRVNWCRAAKCPWTRCHCASALKVAV